MKYVVADGRTIVAAWIIVIAIGKAMAPGLAAYRLGWSRAVRRPVAVVAVVGASLAEVVGAVACLTGVAHGIAAAGVIVGVGLAVTGVGWRNIGSVGSCGCGGAWNEGTSVDRLAARNVVIFGVLALGARFGPSVSSFDDPGIALAVAISVVIVAVCVGVLGGVRLVKARSFV